MLLNRIFSGSKVDIESIKVDIRQSAGRFVCFAKQKEVTMASDRGYLEFILEQLADLDGVRAPRDRKIVCDICRFVVLRQMRYW